MEKKYKIIIIVTIVVVCLLVFGIALYFIFRNKKFKNNLKGGNYNINNYEIKEDDINKINFLAKNKVLFITKYNENDKYVYNIIEIYYNLIDILCNKILNKSIKNIDKENNYKENIESILNKDKIDTNLYICGLSVKRFRSIYNSLNKTEQYNIYINNINKIKSK